MAPRSGRPRRRRRGRGAFLAFVLLLVLILAWPVGLLIWANGKIQHVDAGESSLSTAGTTYLLAGSDSRDDDENFTHDPTEGQRADTIMILTVPPSGNTSLISLPRDTYMEIPGHGWNKLNAAYSWGGPELLRASVESLTGIEVDHYVEIGMGGLANVVDAVGGVELCLDYDVSDRDSRLEWEAGCHISDGDTALAFARMRAADPMGDIGRTLRQQQVIQAITSTVADPALAVRPGQQVDLLESGLGALYVSENSNIIDLGRMALAFRNATGPDGVRGAPPIASMNHRPGGVGSTVLLEDHYPAFFASVADGSVEQGDVDGD
ncbi:LCP family protein [Pseudactinotalea sp. Z1748]|uniref:LCP family protein n=1 Tax=Pseudactinotalea sp. Z1748 TaxID=3413027 RepID=UPI003C7B5520